MSCMKSVRIRIYSGEHFPAIGLNTEQNNSKCGYFLRSDGRTRITDASKLGWGAVLGVPYTNESFALEETELHINVLELKAIYFDF